jgi:nicotinamide mononucleotide (NMN) deamidase PncC
VADSTEALCALLKMSEAKLAAFGWISEMVAAEAAALLIDTYEGGWGLAVLGDVAVDGDVYGEETGQTFVALATPDTTIVRRYPYGGSGFLARNWITYRTLDLVRRQALVRLVQG